MTEIIDMAQFTEAKSDQLNADDLVGGATRTLKVTRVTGADGDQPVSIFYEGDNGKPFKPCKTMRRVLAAVWGRFANEYVGRTMVVYRDDAVTFGGLQVGGIRISHMSHIDKETIVVVMKSKGKKAGIKVLPLKEAASPPSSNGRAKAEKWTNEFIASPSEGPATDKILAKLKAEYPDLHEQAMAAVRQSADSDPFGDDPPAGKPDEDRGEATTLADACNEIAACELVADVNSRLAALKPLLTEEEGDELASYALKRIAALSGGQ